MPFSDMAERLLALRTPAEIAVAPDGETIVFSRPSGRRRDGLAHAERTVVASRRGAGGPADRWRRTPVWSPDGSRLAFLSDRVVPGHALPYTMALDGEPVLAAIARGLRRGRCPGPRTAAVCS